jgi:myo-inositol-1(or 4)-monophosphatase
LIDVLRQTIKDVCTYQLDMAKREALTFEGKSTPLDFASEVDHESQRMITEAVGRDYPDASVIAEEKGGDKAQGFPDQCFIVDPLDGTANYRAKIDLWAVSVALLQGGVAAESIIAFPTTGEVLTQGDLKKPDRTPQSLSEVSTYGIDSMAEAMVLPGLKAKRRQFGSTVYSLLLCCRRAFEGRPALDLGITGSSNIWVVAGPAAFLRAIGGAMFDVKGRDLTQVNLLELMGGAENAHRYSVKSVSCANPDVAREAYEAGILSAF